MKRSFVAFLFILAFLISCKKEVSPADNGSALAKEGRDAFYDLMNNWYYWYKMIPAVNPVDFKDPYEMLDTMRYKTLDRWSFVADYDAFVSEMQGTFVGHGFRIGIDDSGNARIAMIYSNSPLYSVGVRRGWIVKKINDKDIAPILISGDAKAYKDLIGPGTAGISNTFIFIKPDGSQVSITSVKASFTINSVLLYDTLHLSSGITGQLVFESFIEPSPQELATAFAYFKQNNVVDLILDLRYNPGGILDVAAKLASYIGGSSLNGTTLVKREYNDLLTSKNDSILFKSITSQLNLKHLIVINTRVTASASEIVISGLKPHMDVICLGDTTEGKLAGMDVWSYKNTYIFAPVTFILSNSADERDIFTGIPPLKYVRDDITHDFNDRRELCLKEAIHYLETGSVSSKGEFIYRHSAQFSEKPAWMNNAFVFEK
jgi:carboxyl-terminal processing protease